MIWWFKNQWYLWQRDKHLYASALAHLEDNLYWCLQRRHLRRISAEQVRCEQSWMNLDISVKERKSNLEPGWFLEHE